MDLKLVVDNSNIFNLVGYTEPDNNGVANRLYSKFSSIEEHIESQLDRYTTFGQRFRARFISVKIGRFKPVGEQTCYMDYFLFLCRECKNPRVSYNCGFRSLVCKTCLHNS